MRTGERRLARATADRLRIAFVFFQPFFCRDDEELKSNGRRRYKGAMEARRAVAI